MRNILIIFTLFIINFAKAQVVTFDVDTLICFEHSGNITTGYAMRHNQYSITGLDIGKETYSFNFDSMILTHTNTDGKVSECVILEKEFTKDSTKTFHAIFITSETNRHVDVILSTGIDKKDGYVVYFRMNERTNGIVTTKGGFQTNIEVK